jgi:hypothetical protein
MFAIYLKVKPIKRKLEIRCEFECLEAGEEVIGVDGAVDMAVGRHLV